MSLTSRGVNDGHAQRISGMLCGVYGLYVVFLKILSVKPQSASKAYRCTISFLEHDTLAN